MFITRTASLANVVLFSVVSVVGGCDCFFVDHVILYLRPSDRLSSLMYWWLCWQ